MTIYSDTTTNVTSVNGLPQPRHAAAAAIGAGRRPDDCGSVRAESDARFHLGLHNGGTASNDAGGPFTGAAWIWPTSNPATPTPASYATFKKGFTLPGPPTTGSI